METAVSNIFKNLAINALLGISLLVLPNTFIANKAYAACSDTAERGVDWKNCRKRNLIMEGFNFIGSDFTRADLSASDLRNTNVTDSIFVKTNLVRASLAGSIAENANFESVVASRTDFSRGNYKNSNFNKAEITRANFSGSNLENATLTKADFSRVNFFNANMKGVDLSFSNVSRSNFTSIKLDEEFSLKGSFMFLTQIESLDLSKLKGLAQWQIDMACGNDQTKLPEGLTKPANWPCEFGAQD